MSNTSPQWPIATELPSELAFLANHISTYFSASPPYNQASLGALIFSSPPQTLRLLLIQGQKNADPNAFASAWELPSGVPKASDLTLLHALSRIVLEQTGLHLSRVYTMPGSQSGPGTEEPQWMKLQFTVSVAELDCDPERFSHQQTLAYQAGLPENYNFHSARSQSKDPTAIPIQLNPETHSRYAWVTEDELREFARSGLYPTEEVNQYQSMLDAFALYKQDCDLVVNRDRPGEDVSPPSTTANSSRQSSVPADKPRSTTQPSKSPAKPNKSTSSRQGSSSKSKPDPSHFHRFRIT